MIRATTATTECQTSFTNGTHSSLADVPLEKGGKGEGFGRMNYWKQPSPPV